MPQGNIEADKLANEARERATILDTQNKIDKIRDQILFQSAVLVSGIDQLLEENPHEVHEQNPTDGPSRDDFRASDAIRNVSFNVP